MPRSTAQMRSRQTVLLQKWADQMPCSWDSVSAACVVSDVCPRRAFPPQEWFVPDTRGEQGKLHIDSDSKVYVDLWTGRLESRSSFTLGTISRTHRWSGLPDALLSSLSSNSGIDIDLDHLHDKVERVRALKILDADASKKTT